jgi:glycosyltransferase involved in cell wall biosynthesis
MSYAPILSEAVLQHRENNTTTHHPHYTSSRSSSKPSPSARRQRRKATPRNGQASAAKDYPIVVHSHLCWDWVWQRPQQFVSRLSKKHPILFVETVAPDPELAAPMAKFRTSENFPNITLLRLQFPTWRWEDGTYVDRTRRQLVQDFIASSAGSRFRNPVQWFYDPMAVTSFAGHMDEILTVYDCMDELSKFRCAPPEIVKREAELLARADVVFTGGRKLYEAKSHFHDNCHFYGCGVDWKHFGNALKSETMVPPDLSNLRRPVLGYFGVVDERMDYELLAQLADANPEWSVAMVGPVLKVEESVLPRRENLHWLGQRAYEDLPALCKGFDVCLMPFALNESTEFINPTKALEYMATGRPIVSTGVADVIRNFGSVVKVAETAAEFVELCREAIAKCDTACVECGLQMARDNSWESIVSQLENHIEEALCAKHKNQV